MNVCSSVFTGSMLALRIKNILALLRKIAFQQEAEVKDNWDKDNSNKFYSRHLFFILRWFQDTGTY